MDTAMKDLILYQQYVDNEVQIFGNCNTNLFAIIK